jgi:hypothetical protein
MNKSGIPNPDTVKNALKLTDKRLKTAIRRVNIEAARHTRSGDYEGAEKWIQTAKSVMDYQSRLKAFVEEWHTIVKSSRLTTKRKSGFQKVAKKSPVTPMWQFCTPALKALEQEGGKAKIEDLVPIVGKIMQNELKPRDQKITAKKGIPSWQIKVLMLGPKLKREGWIIRDRNKILKLTDKGRKVIK